MLAREVLRLRGTLASREVEWDVVVDLYFYRDPEAEENKEGVTKPRPLGLMRSGLEWWRLALSTMLSGATLLRRPLRALTELLSQMPTGTRAPEQTGLRVVLQMLVLPLAVLVDGRRLMKDCATGVAGTAFKCVGAAAVTTL